MQIWRAEEGEAALL
jgi:hypothetical protein